MHSIAKLDNVATMTSLELVGLINEERDREDAEKNMVSSQLRHADFMAKLERHPGIDSAKFSGQYKDSTGRTLKCYFLPKRECELMAMSESLRVQTRVYDRLKEIEAKPAQPVALPNYAEALRQLADKIEEAAALAIERDHAIATKAQIGSKREATAMATAATAKREAAKLKDQLGFSARHATILQVEDATGGDFGFLELRRWCKANEVTPETVPDKRYPKGIKAWPAGAWMAVYGVDLAGLFGEAA